MSTRSSRRRAVEAVVVPPPLAPLAEEEVMGSEEEVDEGISSEGEVYEEEEYEDDDLGEETDDEEEGLEENWGDENQGEDDVSNDEEDIMIDEVEEEDGGSMSPTDAIDEVKPGADPICYHCGVPLVDPPMRLLQTAGSHLPDGSSASVLSPMQSPTAATLSIPLHCEVCVRGIHSQCHISLGGALPTQEESFVCFHCRTSQHGKYAMKAADRVRVLVGPDHQVPCLPPMFFTLPKNERFTVARTRFEQVWSAETSKVVIPDECKRIQSYIQQAAQVWPDRLRVNSSNGNLAPGSVRRLYLPRSGVMSSNNGGGSLHHYWCPFSSDFALTILHRCNYDTNRALAVLQNPHFRDCFTQVCHPPTLPYYNKWKPKDRRWRMMKIPFPSSRSDAPLLDIGNAYSGDYGNGGDGIGSRTRSSRRYYNYY